jgi:Protein of unknown function (DUF1559)
MQPEKRTGFTLFQLLILVALMALGLGLALPAVAKARMTATQARDTNNLKQLALAMVTYADSMNGALPSGMDKQGFSAAAYLLPYIEQDQLYKSIDFKAGIDAEANVKARQAKVAVFLSGRDPIDSVKADWGATNYLYNDQVFGVNTSARYPASFPDGTSNTIVIGETLRGDGGNRAKDVKRQHVLLKKAALKGLKPDAGVDDFKNDKNIAGDRCSSWMDGRFLQGMFNGQLKPNDARPDVSCEGAGGVSALRSLNDTILVALGDGSVKAVSAKNISHKTWLNAICPNDGNVLGDDW